MKVGVVAVVILTIAACSVFIFRQIILQPSSSLSLSSLSLFPQMSQCSLMQKNEKHFHQLCELDRARVSKLRSSNPSKSTPDQFYALLMDTFDTVCNTKIKFGGQYVKYCHARDGHKYVCMDELIKDVRAGTCLVYTFGLADDWSFEEAMGTMGCQVYAHDPTIKPPDKIPENVLYHKMGIVARPNGDRFYKTLEQLIKDNGHWNSKISYLKIDVEGEEMRGLPSWLKSGALDHVQQLAIEIHISHRNEIAATLKFFETFKQIQLAGNFRVINFDPNHCANIDCELKFLRVFEVVFKKINNDAAACYR